ncbi:hypothetical protein SLNSH_01965 [Alsobacter soli]|uniref:OmpA-like domain-containing protein n=2 Tax=Alsobacter soli TaxID=2109933 RepID=A0A2T1HY35_9HYPH|nr:hypothetical protein SLNSH_01965 [Alsobacter soli]
MSRAPRSIRSSGSTRMRGWTNTIRRRSTAKGEGDEQEATTEDVEGRITKFTYEHKPGTSALEILRQYENALAKVGFLKLVSGRRAKLPTHALINGDTFGAFRLDRYGKPAVYVNVGASDQGSWVESHVVIAEPGVMEQKLNADADSFFDQLGSSGRVVVYGINFDTARAGIRADSESVLAEIERLLKTHEDLKLRVEGHTDNIGQPAANQKLSQLRAAAVVSWLMKHGIKQGRLTAVGLGDKAPLADNQT